MSERGCELADIVRQHGDAYLERHGRQLSFQQQRALYDIARCRTAAMGGHVDVCTNCGALRNAYNSCRNRHCPKCLGSARARWTAAREVELLPVCYFHVVFTVPHEIAPIALQNQRVVYDILFQAASQTLNQVALDERHLGARIGSVMVLHTWGQALLHHPHVHCVVPGGGLAPDGSRWIHCRDDFFLPVRVDSPEKTTRDIAYRQWYHRATDRLQQPHSAERDDVQAQRGSPSGRHVRLHQATPRG